MWTSGDLPWALAGTRHWDLHWPAMFAVASALFAATFALDSTTNTSRYDNFNPLTQTCYLTFSRGAFIGDMFYISGGFFQDPQNPNRGSLQPNGTLSARELLPNMWLRIFDTSKPFKTSEVDSLPITFQDPPANIPEIYSGSLWAYNNSLWQLAGASLGTDGNDIWPGWNAVPNDTVYDFVKYDPARDSWLEDRRTAGQTVGPMNMIVDGFSVVVEPLAKAFMIGGSLGPNSTTSVSGMVTYDFQREEWEQLSTPWSSWQAGLAVHVPVENPGYMVAFAGRRTGRDNINDLSQIEIYDLSSKIWLPTQNATAADPRFGIPGPRIDSCYVIARAKDGSSYNIYIFGGAASNNLVTFNEVWVLSIPSFKWFLAAGGDTGSPPFLATMSCALVGGHKMLIYGGDNGFNDWAACTAHQSLTYIFDLTSLTWQDAYEPSGTYEVPELIYNVIGGGPHGGATLLPEGGLTAAAMEQKFREIINKVNETSNGSEESSPKSATPESPPRNTLRAGQIAGIAIGSLLGLTCLGLGILCLARRRISSSRPTSQELMPPTELVGCQLEPRELLASYKYPAQELHGYTPPELDSGLKYSGYRAELPGSEQGYPAAYDQQEDKKDTEGTGTL